MITITYDIKSNRYCINVNGHAGYNPGNDIVCSACSMLTLTLAETIRARKYKHKYDIASGSTRITVYSNNDNNTSIESMFDMAIRGYKMLAREYPNNVRLNMRN